MPKFLIIRFSSIGDIVLTSPVERCIKQQVADSEIHFLTKKSYEGVVASNPYVSKVFTIQDDLNSLLPVLKSEQYDYVIDLHKNLRSLKVKAFLGRKYFSFPKSPV